MNIPSHSHGWERLTDLEIAQWVTEKDAMPIDWLLEETGELAKRGMKIKECAECRDKEVVYDHDYICILCRKGGRAD
jgi:hypothetical protein